MRSWANLLFLLAFLLSTLVQFNDPDAMLWIVLYASATVICLLHHLGRSIRLAALSLAGLSAGGIILLVSGIPGSIPWSDVFASLAMRSDAVEEAREIGGLVLVGAWMLKLGLENRDAKSGPD